MADRRGMGPAAAQLALQRCSRGRRIARGLVADPGRSIRSLIYRETLTMEASHQLDCEFLPLRAKLLDMAAAIDRLDRGTGAVNDDPRMARIRQAMEILLDRDSDRVERIQMVFSRTFEEDWAQRFGLTL
jgi:hypothetical protein